MVVCIVPCSTNPFASLLSPCSWRSVVSLSFSICCLLVPEGLLSPCSLRSVVSCSLRSVVFLSLVVFLLSACLWWSFCCMLVSDGLSVVSLSQGVCVFVSLSLEVCCVLVSEGLCAVVLSLSAFLLFPCPWGSVCCRLFTEGLCCLLITEGLCCVSVTEGLSTFSLSLWACVLSGCPWRSAVKGNS